MRAQVAAAIHLVISTERLMDGTRKITAISEVLPLDARGDYQVQDIYLFTQTARDAEGVQGYHAPTGVVPSFQRKLLANGFAEYVDDYFDPSLYGLEAPPLFEGRAKVGPNAAPRLGAKSTDTNIGTIPEDL